MRKINQRNRDITFVIIATYAIIVGIFGIIFTFYNNQITLIIISILNIILLFSLIPLFRLRKIQKKIEKNNNIN